MIESKEFVIPYSGISRITTDLHIDALRAIQQKYIAAPFKLQVFKKAGGGLAKGVIVIFSGGDGVYTMPITNVYAQYAENDYIFVNFTASLNMVVPTYLSSAYLYGWEVVNHKEVDVALETVFTTVISDVDFSGRFTQDTPVYLVGFSRGAAILTHWNEVQNSLVFASPYAAKVKGIGCNSPSGSNVSFRATRLLSKTICGSVPTLVIAGADDRTHILRAEAERLNRAFDPWGKVKFKVFGGVGSGHNAAAGREHQFLDEVIDFANTP